MGRFLLVCAALAFLAACSDGGNTAPAGDGAPTAVLTPEADPQACTPVLVRSPGDSPESLPSGGLTREYLLHIPPSYDGASRMPLLLAFHPYAANKEFFAEYSALGALADERGFIVAFPDGTGDPRRWNSGLDPAGADDIAFTRDLLTKLDGELCIDASRTYAAGYSNGGGMAQRAVCEIPEAFAALAVVASTYTNCRVPVPLVAFHGLEDATVPFEGGGDNLLEPGVHEFQPVRKNLSEWARTAGCDGLPNISRPAPEVELSTFLNCPIGEGSVLLYAIIPGGHTWPGALIPIPTTGYTTEQINASQTMWDFFEAHPK
ncbi:MAG: PHB depolymerase family esterase [Dehalococcoidia bacterium]